MIRDGAIHMKYIARIALRGIFALALIQAAPLLAPNAFAGATTPSTIKKNKRKKHKKNAQKKEVVLKSRRGKRSRKPA